MAEGSETITKGDATLTTAYAHNDGPESAAIPSCSRIEEADLVTSNENRDLKRGLT
jgi:hypothetical protein